MKKFLFIILIAFVIVSCGKNNEKISSQKKAETKDTKQKIVKIEKAKDSKKFDRNKMMEKFKKFRKNSVPIVKLGIVKIDNLNSFIVLNGVVEPEKKVKIYSRLSAYVKKIIREEGSYVKKDEIIALLDDEEINISYQQARIQLEQSKLTLDDEEKNYNRSKELKKSDLISEQDFQTTKSNYFKAKLEYENKLENLKNLKLQLNYTKIKSPVNGFITERLIEEGDKVNINQHVYTVEDFEPLLIKLYVPASDIMKLKKGMNAVIKTDVLKGKEFLGKIKLINPRIDSQSGTVKVTIEVYDKTFTLKPGMFVEVKILIDNKKDILVIPFKSIVFKSGKSYAFVFDKQTMSVKRVEVKTGISEGDKIEVIKGLNKGDIIVVEGVEPLKEGAKVRVVR